MDSGNVASAKGHMMLCQLKLVAWLETSSACMRTAHQGHHLGELGDKVQGEDGPEDGSPPEGVTQRLGVADGGVEGWALVVDAKGDKLDDELDQEAHRVHQVGLEVRVGLLHLILLPPSGQPFTSHRLVK